MILKDSQPFSFVEDVGFRDLVHALDPNCVFPSRTVFSRAKHVLFKSNWNNNFAFHLQALKAMVEKKYWEVKEKAKEQVISPAAAVSLTSDMWTLSGGHYPHQSPERAHFQFGNSQCSYIANFSTIRTTNRSSVSAIQKGLYTRDQMLI